MPSQTLGSVLAEARKNKEYSLREVAERVKKEDGQPITPQYLNDIEHDRRIPSPEVLKSLGRALQVNEDYLHFLAGILPKDIKGLRVSKEAVIQAYSLFRRNLEK